MMSKAREPEDKNDWKAIDIFLFSNGQESSPPRKYHLVSEQLDWWKATLNSLAKAQYGSLHNMVNLYTMDGQKIETPLELSHNTAYVAVEPPDNFINAGYEKYLIKATRSWEKGQDRRTSNINMVKPEEQNVNDDKSNSDTKEYYINKTRETRDGSVTLKTIVPSMVDDQPSVIVKPEGVKHPYAYMNINPVKQTGRLSRPSIQRPIIVKKNNQLPSPPKTRKPSIKMKDSVKINTETTSSRLSSDTNNIRASSKSKIHNYKPVKKQKDSVIETVLTKVEEIVNETKSSSSLKLSNSKNSMSMVSEAQNVVQENEVVTVASIYKNPDKDHKISIAMNPNTPLLDNINRQGAVHKIFGENGQNDKIKNEHTGEPATIIMTKDDTTYPPLIEHELNSPVTSKMSKPEHELVAFNKEGIVNLKLNIEIWNGNNEPKLTSDTAIKKGLLILNQEKGSQVNIEEYKQLDPDQVLIHKAIANDMSCNEENQKVIFVQCSCHKNGTDNSKNNTFPINNGCCNFMVYLPVLKLDEDTKRCDCKKNERMNSIYHNPSESYPAKKTISCMSLHKEKAEKLSYSEITSRNNSTEIKVEGNLLHEKNEMTTTKRKSVAIKEDQVTFPDLILLKEPTSGKDEEHPKTTIPLELDKSEFMVLKKESTGILHKSANKLTQTEWCDVLLEVKLQSDGHYSFHMPPLKLLKEYKL